jgi:RPA family protein
MSSEEVSREVAWRVFATEYNDADLAFKEGDDERAPNYVATPTGAKINRMFAVGVLTEIERVGDGDLLRARVSDPTGAFVVYAGQYQPDAVSFFADAETPSFVAVVGKARTYEPEDGDDVYTSIRPEEVNVVDAETRDRWNVETAHETLKRTEATRAYIRDGITPETSPEVHELGEVIDHYGTDEAYLNSLERQARDVLTEVAGVEAGTGTGFEEDSGDTDAVTETSEVTDEEETEADERKTPTPEEEEDEREPEAETAGTSEKEEEPADDFEDIEQEEVGDWEWDEGQREEVAEEFGAEFESGADLADSPEEETIEEDEKKTPEDETEASDTEAEEDEDETEETEPETEEASDSAESVVMGIIEEKNGDEGAERSVIIEEAAEQGIGEEVAEATLEDLLLEGMCYPTDGDRIKPL